MKKSVSLQFSKAAQTYEKETIVQKSSAKELKTFIENDYISGKGIDLGCGTGTIDNLPNTNIVGIDISPKMIEKYTEKNQIGIVADIENLPFKNHSFDFAISNFSLHWTNLEKSIQEIHRVLKPNGYLILSIPVKNSFNIIKQILGTETFQFPSQEKVINIISKRFIIKKYHTKTYEIKFKSTIQMLKHLKNTGTTTYKNGKTLGKKLKNYKKLTSFKGEITLNFEVLFIKAIRINTI